MGDAARHLADRFQSLRPQQGLLSGFPPPDLALRLGQRLLLSPGAHQRRPGNRDQRQGGRQAENQMAADRPAPIRGNSRHATARHDVQREVLHLAIDEQAVGRVRIDDGHALVGSRIGMAPHCLEEWRVRHDLRRLACEIRKTNQDLAVVADQGHHAAMALGAAFAQHNLIEVAEKGRRHGDVDHAGERAVQPEPRPRHAEEHLPVHIADLQAADEGAGIALHHGPEVIPAADINL